MTIEIVEVKKEIDAMQDNVRGFRFKSVEYLLNIKFDTQDLVKIMFLLDQKYKDIEHIRIYKNDRCVTERVYDIWDFI